MEIHEGSLPTKLEETHRKYILHIMKECLVVQFKICYVPEIIRFLQSCRGKGHVCRLCSCLPEVFPFENHVTRCHTCHAVYHKECYKKNESVCPKCVGKE